MKKLLKLMAIVFSVMLLVSAPKNISLAAETTDESDVSVFGIQCPPHFPIVKSTSTSTKTEKHMVVVGVELKECTITTTTITKEMVCNNCYLHIGYDTPLPTVSHSIKH